jgi:hypothetical protein
VANNDDHRIRWRLGLIVGVIMMTVALLPQVHFVIHRGQAWHGTNAITHPDEVAYSAYTASLTRGNQRRYDPFTGRGAETGAAESLFSIQIIPAYTIALPGRWLNISAATLFMVFTPWCAFAAALAIFWFLSLLTRDAFLSAVGVIVILCLGTLVAGQGIARYALNLNFLIPLWLSQRVLPPSLYHLPSLRLYQPAVAFPLFFVLCAFVWRALNAASSSRSALNATCAGVTLVTLVFSYFFLWTAAAAWLACLALLYIIFRRSELKRAIMVLGIIAVIALPAAIGYFVLLSHRAPTVDTAQALVLTHRPDLFRFPEMVSVILLLLLASAAWRRVFQGREPLALFAASLAFAVFAIFNQQVVTGRSLQPIHYEWFIGNYCALAAVVLTAKLCWRNRNSPLLNNRRLAIIAVIALAWGVGEVWLAASMALNRNRANDEFRPVAMRLTSLAQAERAPGATVLVSDLALADRLPTDAPQTLLWAPHMLVFPGVNDAEDRERFLQQLYYLGYDEHKIAAQIGTGDWNFFAGLFPYERLSPVITGKSNPIMPDEIRARIKDYLNYASSFDRERAASSQLAYVVVRANESVDFQNLDRWYQRDSGEVIGDFVLYRVKLH